MAAFARSGALVRLGDCQLFEVYLRPSSEPDEILERIVMSERTREVRVRDVVFGGSRPFGFIAGPCVIEDEETTLRIASRLEALTGELGIPFVFKASYDKANRTSAQSFRGPGLEAGLRILWRVKRECGCPVLSDVHSVDEIGPASEVLDVIQIPALLCRQTSLIQQAARRGLPLNIKKGQFMAPWDMRHVVEKAAAVGNENVLLTERGTIFGYNNLVVDFRGLEVMRSLGYPVVFDATHSVQLPGGFGSASSGERQFVAPLIRAAMAVGVDGLFLEVHENPDEAKCDGPTMLPLNSLREILQEAKELDQFVRMGQRRQHWSTRQM